MRWHLGVPRAQATCSVREVWLPLLEYPQEEVAGAGLTAPRFALRPDCRASPLPRLTSALLTSRSHSTSFGPAHHGSKVRFLIAGLLSGQQPLMHQNV
jgi:hypothetical protein